MGNFKDLKSRFEEMWHSDKKVKWITAIGIAGMILILLSTYTPKKNAASVSTASEPSTAEYVADLENRLSNMVSGIDGVGEVRIMVTVNKGAEYVYVREDKSSDEKMEERTASEIIRREERISREEQYLLVDNENGDNQALLQTRLEPEIKGVAVVCDGGENVVVQKTYHRCCYNCIGNFFK